jgi:transposase
MKRKKGAPVFKPYVMNQISLLPANYEDVIPAKHIVRTVNQAIEAINLTPLLEQYKGGGTSSYHPKLMLKVLVYAYTQRIYSSRRIAKSLRENIYFMWLSGGTQPDFRTINGFRSSRMKAVIEEVFGSVLEYLMEHGYVKMEQYFLDGTKIEADANKHKVVWAKRNATYTKRVREKIHGLLDEIERVNAEEQEEYGDRDLEEMGEAGPDDIGSAQLQEKIEALNRRLQEKGRSEKTAQAALHKLEKDCLPRLQRYEQQVRILGGRSSYSKTDPDASSMRMKEDRGSEKPWPRPAYNIQMGTEGQFITGFSIHTRAGDTGCLIPHLAGMERQWKRLPEKMIADAAYGSEENYAYLEKHGIGNFLKYNTFYQDTHRYRDAEMIQKRRFQSDQFPYDERADVFYCPAGKPLSFVNSSRHTTENGYPTERRHYECQACPDCPLKSQCTKADRFRRIQVSHRLRAYREQARKNLTSEEGQELRAKRSIEVETGFGNIKQNMGFRRFHLRGEEKVKTEWGVVCIAHNMRKMAA